MATLPSNVDRKALQFVGAAPAGDGMNVSRSTFGAASTGADYASERQRVTWGTRTRQGDLCFSGLRTLREARRLKTAWDAQFPDYAPYSLTRNAKTFGR